MSELINKLQKLESADHADANEDFFYNRFVNGMHVVVLPTDDKGKEVLNLCYRESLGESLLLVDSHDDSLMSIKMLWWGKEDGGDFQWLVRDGKEWRICMSDLPDGRSSDKYVFQSKKAYPMSFWADRITSVDKDKMGRESFRYALCDYDLIQGIEFEEVSRSKCPDPWI